jgi:hypothetical protein
MLKSKNCAPHVTTLLAAPTTLYVDLFTYISLALPCSIAESLGALFVI